MAQSKNELKLHKAQDAFASESFGQYKERIAREFIDKFGGSYQRYEEIGDNWRKIYQYAQECEKFLKERTIIFLGTLPERNGLCRSPRFLKNLIAQISEYLSVYVSQQFENASQERNKCTRALIEYFTNHHAINKIMTEFQAGKEREWGLKKKAWREEKEARAKQRELAKERAKEKKAGRISVHIEVTYTHAQHAKVLWQQIESKKAELANGNFKPRQRNG